MRTPQITRYRDIARERLGALPHEMLTRFYQAMGARQFEEREGRRRAVRTVQQWERERDALKARLLATIGELPAASLEVVDKGFVETRHVRVRKLLFESYPGNWVPANVYLPRSIAEPCPGIVLPCGHSLGGRAGWDSRGAQLAARGYVAIAFDYVGNGERRIAPYFTSTQHNIIGRKMKLAGYNLLALMIQETMAAVEVLMGLDEVDAERIGITGSSGGGTLSVFASACDPRIGVAAPAASVRSFSEGVVADDSEQCLFDMVRRGLDYPDVLSFLVAPRPLLIVANTEDIWPLPSARYAFEEAHRLYELLGHGERIAMTVTEGGHQCTTAQFDDIVRWFDRWLKPGGEPAAQGEIEAIEDPRSLWLSRTGNLFEDGWERPDHAFCSFLNSRPAGAPDVDGFLAFLRSTAPADGEPLWEEIDWYEIGPLEGKRVIYSAEKGLLLPAEVLAPRTGPTRGAAVLLDDTDRRDMQDWQVQVASDGWVAVRPDLRGWGETLPEEQWQDWENWCENIFSGRRYRAYGLAELVGRHIVLDRVKDVIALISGVVSAAGVSDVWIWGKRQGAWVALLTALCDERVRRVTMDRCLQSFRDVLQTDVPVWHADSTIYGLLQWGVDVADLVQAASCEVEVLDSVNALLQPVSQKLPPRNS